MRNIKVIAVLGVMVVGVISPLLILGNASAATLASESFNGISTPANTWTSGGQGSGNVACLTAASVSAANSIPRCSASPSDTAGNGFLRLTPAIESAAGFAIYNTPISAVDGLEIEFNMYQYGGTGADGISFFLIDGSKSPTAPGAYGGSLGYSDGGGEGVGLVGGYVGIGFDRFGNFSNPAFGNGGPGPVANSITVRGSEATDYQYITRASASGSLSGTTRANSLRKVKINVSTANIMSVSIDYGSGFVNHLSGINLNTINGAGTKPATFKMGFAASTGGSTNTHEIGGLTVKSNPPNVSLAMSNSSPVVQGSNVQFTLSGTNAASAEDTTGNIVITQTLPTGLTPLTATGTGWDCTIVSQVITCTRPGSGANTLSPGQSTPNIIVTAKTANNAGTPLNVSAELTTDGNSPLATTTRQQSIAVQLGSYLDDDGIFNVIEDESPNDGDGNDDGELDSEQDNVTSLPNSLTGKYAVLETDGCSSRNSAVSVVPESSNAAGDNNYTYPAGMMDFSVICSAPGGTTTVTQYYYGTYDVSKLVARKYNAVTKTYATIPNALLSNTIIAGEPVLKIQYQLTDGGSLDQDGIADGTIIDPAGPALQNASLNTPAATATAGTPNTGLGAQSLAAYYTAALTGLGLILYETIRQRRTKTASNQV